jgi:hypothetical protein
MYKLLRLTSISVIFLVLFWYISLPNPEFPKPPADAVQSNEPADVESPSRRAYFTNLTREDVIIH